MMIIGCDFHPSFQQIAYAEQETGEYEERRLSHREEAEAFYRSLAGKAVRIGVEATGNDRWFHKLMSELGHELLVGGRQRDSCFGTARAADRQAGGEAHFEIAGGESVSSHLAAIGGQPGTAAVAVASLPASAHADADQKSVGFYRQERGTDRFADLEGEASPADRGVALVLPKLTVDRASCSCSCLCFSPVAIGPL
jgi:hypothetical protein